MNKEDAINRAAELSKEYGTVTSITINVNDEQVSGFFKEPSYDVLLYINDCILDKQLTKGAEAIVKNCLIPEESDPRIIDTQNNPRIAASFVIAATKLAKLYTGDMGEIKKN